MSRLARTRVLVTGAHGFIGANLVHRLVADGADVHALVRAGSDGWRLRSVSDRVAAHVADLRDAEAVRRVFDAAGPHVVFHSAKHRGDTARADYRAAYADNVFGTLHVLEAAARQGTSQVIHLGSSLEYGSCDEPLHEVDALRPTTVHGATKAAAAILAQQFGSAHGLPVTVLRLFTVYGPWEHPSRFVPTVITAALSGRPIRLTAPHLAHDWVHVDDVVEACMRTVACAGAAGEVINIGTGRQHGNGAVVDVVEMLTGRPIAREPVPFPARPWDTACWVANVEKAASVLGWHATRSLTQGLDETIRWFAARQEMA